MTKKNQGVTTELKVINSVNSISTYPNIDRVSQVGFSSEQLVPKPTYVEAGIEKLAALCHAVGLKDKTAQAIEIFRAMTLSWGNSQIGDKSGWQSNLSDDFSPFEFSIAFKENRAELRVLLEAQGAEPNLQSNWEAGLKLNQYLAERYNISLDRFRQIEDLFVPTNPDAKLGIWHSVCFYSDKEPEFKLYLNPQAQVKSRAAAVVEESLVRLGFSNIWSNLAEIAAQRGPDKDEFVYFSLDLSSDPTARVKVYLRHYDATVDDLEKALSLAKNYVVGDVTEFCQVMSEGQNIFTAKPAISCFSWVEGDKFTPSSGILHLPISNYAANDLVVRDRLDRYFRQYDLPVSLYHSVIQSLATHPLETGIGMHSYTSLFLDRQQRRVTVYLNPEINQVRPSTTTLASQSVRSLPSIEALTSHYKEYGLNNHPFLQRLQREQVNPQYIWLLLANLGTAIIPHVTRRLANIISRIDDDRIRCILAKQLNEELGNGNIDGIHKQLFEQMMTEIEPWRVESFSKDILKLGNKMSDHLEKILLDPNPYIGVGAAIVMEIYAEQFYLCLGKELRRTTIDISRIPWATLHEELDVVHAEESFILARFVDDSEEGVIAARQGMEKFSIAAWTFLGELYQLCFDSIDREPKKTI